MVRALEDIHRLLRPTGTLIEIHPILEAPVVEVRSNGDGLFAEPDPGFDYGDDVRHAEEAVASIVRRRMFVLDRSREFDFLTHASSVAELRDHFAIADAYDPAVKDEALVRRQDELYERVQAAVDVSPEDREVVYHERARMSRLTPI